MSSLRFSRLADAFDALLTPPFKGAPVIVWLCYALFFLFNKSLDLWHGNLLDPDDYLYLVQAIDALKGHAWFDLFQHRMNPPDGTLVHYSHLLSGFYAGFIFLLQPCFGTVSAAIITAAILPPLYFAAFLFALHRIAHVLIDKKWADLTAYFVFFSPSLMSQFMPGHIDHHGLVVLIAVIAFGCIVHMITQPASFLWPVATGGLLALGLVLGLELIAVICLLTTAIGVWAMAEGGRAARNGLVFAVSFFLVSVALLGVTRSPAHFFDADILAYSIVYVIMAGCFAGCFLGVALAAGTASPWPRFVIGTGLAFITGSLFLHNFPALAGGPYGAMDPALAKLIFAAAPEAWPLMRPHAPWIKTIMPLLAPLTAFAAALFMLVRSKSNGQRWLWGMTAFLTLVAAGLATFYQARFLYFAQAFAVLPLTAMVRHDWMQKTKSGSRAQIARTLRLGFLLLVAPLSATIAGDYSDATMTEVSPSASAGCDMHTLVELLDDPQAYGKHPRLIINTINEGPELLFRTPHSVLAGPYHTNVTGNTEAMRFFTTRDPAEAKAIAATRGAGLVVMCDMPVQMLIYKTDGDRGNGPVFARQLIEGKIPGWLKPVPVSPPNNLKLFEIRQEAR